MLKDLNMKASIGYLTGMAMGFWVHLGPTMQVLVILIGFDILTGLISGYIKKSLDSTVGRRGVAQKALILILCNVGSRSSSILNIGFDVGSAIAGFYCVNELLSIVENCDGAGVPIPEFLKSAMKKVREAADIGPRNFREASDPSRGGPQESTGQDPARGALGKK